MKIKYYICVPLLTSPVVSHAFNFTLSQVEFNTWDDRCKKAFSASGAGRNSGYYPKLTPQQNAEVLRFAEDAGGAWHYCAGVIYLQRAKSSLGVEREGNLRGAISEMQFTARNIRLDHSWYPEIQIDLARAYFEAGDDKAGFATLQNLLKIHQNNSLAYTALAYYLKRKNQLQEAITTLQSAPVLLLQESAELNYFLGWYLMEAGNTDAALPYAKRAYELNYPVPTLRKRLAASGYSW